MRNILIKSYYTMTKYLFWVAVIATATTIICGFIIGSLTDENSRLRHNQASLVEDVVRYRTEANTSAASVEALRLTLSEFREHRAKDALEIESLGIRLRRAESYARSIAESNYTATTMLRDTIVIRDTICDTLRHFAHHDPWCSIEGDIAGDTLHCNIRTIDTLHQVVHRVPRKFLFIRYGTKAIRQEVWTSNPHTELVYTEYIELGRRKKRK